MSFTILGTGSYAPEHVVTNDDLAKIVETNDEWIMQRIGVKSRHICDTETNVDLAVEASVRALEDAGVAAEELDLIIATTISGDTLSPGTGCMVQKRIGAHCPALDLAAACSGFLFALETAAGWAAAGAAEGVGTGVAAVSTVAGWLCTSITASRWQADRLKQKAAAKPSAASRCKNLNLPSPSWRQKRKRRDCQTYL